MSMVSNVTQPVRRRFVLGACALALSSTLGGAAVAASDAYPNRAITLVLAYPPGGGVDLVGRLLARELEQSLGQTVVVENRPGAGSLIGTNAVIRSKPDGYTLLLADPALVINSSLMAQVPYNVERDLTPISTVTLSPLVLSVPSASPIKTLEELVAAGKQSGKGLNYASAGLGSTPHMAGELLTLRTGANLVHVPYKGSGPAMTDLIGGSVDFAFATQPAASQYIAQGRLRGLATTGAQRSALLPDLPTVADTYAGFQVLFWTALVAPAGTPESVIETLNKAVGKSLQSETMMTGLQKAGENASYMSVADTKAFFKKEDAMWSKVVKDGGLQLK